MTIAKISLHCILKVIASNGKNQKKKKKKIDNSYDKSEKKIDSSYDQVKL